MRVDTLTLVREARAGDVAAIADVHAEAWRVAYRDLFESSFLAKQLEKKLEERGKEVRQRTKDTWGLWRQGVLNPDSNVQFGEGGAGTFSDGKLWSQISDPRHLTRKVLTDEDHRRLIDDAIAELDFSVLEEVG